MEKKEVVEELKRKLNSMMDLLIAESLDSVIKFEEEDLYSVLQDIENELEEI